jgi:hypothetical protein
VGDRTLGLVVRVERIEAWLDDAFLDFSTLCDLGAELTVAGNRAGRIGSRRLRFPVRFLFHEVSDWEIVDSEGADGLLVDDLRFDADRGGLVLSGPLPGHLYVRTPCRQVTVQTSTTPLRRTPWRCELPRHFWGIAAPE